MHNHYGKLIANALRSKNRLYKVHMRIRDDLSLLSTATSDSSRWHARLGHINVDTMKFMIQRELVIEIPQFEIEKRVCGSCLMGKQTRQTFPQSTSYRATNILELVHGDLCGPISPNTSAGNKYVLVQTRVLETGIYIYIIVIF